MPVPAPLSLKQRDTPYTRTTSVLKTNPQITWETLPDDFKLPDDPVENLDQPLLAEALREALLGPAHLNPERLVATNFGLVATVNGQKVVKAPDFVYVPSVLPLPTGKKRKSYTPYAEGELPTIVMEFQRLTPSNQKRYWISPLKLFLGVWHGTKERSDRTGYWLRWWDASGNLLLWNTEDTQEALERAEQAKERAEQAEERAEQAEERAEQAKQEKQVALAEKQTALETAQQAEKTTTLMIAKQMLQANTDIAFIRQITGLGEQEIENLIEKG